MTAAIVTATLAAAVDRTYRIDRYESGSVNRARAVSTELSGKGVNVALALAPAGVPVRAVLPLGPAESRSYPADAVLRPIPVSRATRINISIVEADGTTTKVNEGATPLDAAEWEAFIDACVHEIEETHASWFVLCGTMPTLAESGKMAPFEQLLDRAAACGAHLVVDTSGAALDRVLAYDGVIAAVKPNTHELTEATGRTLETVGDVIDAAQSLRRRGIETVYVSMGADGALVVGEGDAYLGTSRVARPVNTVGAGDASLAGFLASLAERTVPDAHLGPEDLARVARTAAGWGALAVTQPTTVLQDPASAPAASVMRADPRAVLGEPARP